MPGLFMNFNPFERLPSNQHGFTPKTIGKGSLIAFSYPYSYAVKPNTIHDPYPLLVVTDIWPKYVRGVNLHYLTFPYIKKILTESQGNTYSYYNVKPDKYVASAFRMYNRQGMSQVKKMDSEFLLTILTTVKSFSENEIDNVKQKIQEQIRDRLQVKANEMAKLDFTKNQNDQISRKAGDMQQTIQGGVQRNLINPQQYKTGQNPANFNLPAGGPLSTNNLTNPQG